MSMSDDRGFHLEIQEYGEKQQHYHDTDINRFIAISERLIDEQIKIRGTIKDDNGEKIARSIDIKLRTV